MSGCNSPRRDLRPFLKHFSFLPPFFLLFLAPSWVKRESLKVYWRSPRLHFSARLMVFSTFCLQMAVMDLLSRPSRLPSLHTFTFPDVAAGSILFSFCGTIWNPNEVAALNVCAAEGAPHVPRQKLIFKMSTWKEKKVLTPQFSLIIQWSTNPLTLPRQTLQMYQELNTNLPSARFDCRLIPQIRRESRKARYLSEGRGRAPRLGRGWTCRRRRRVWGCFLPRCCHLKQKETFWNVLIKTNKMYKAYVAVGGY